MGRGDRFIADMNREAKALSKKAITLLVLASLAIFAYFVDAACERGCPSLDGHQDPEESDKDVVLSVAMVVVGFVIILCTVLTAHAVPTNGGGLQQLCFVTIPIMLGLLGFCMVGMICCLVPVMWMLGLHWAWSILVAFVVGAVVFTCAVNA